ncbi:hypothetical protein PybrP1_003871 [[Pythium] brassicae (nom. inval.)]|nr:hypothetical protein PybrP1_003871 [[Pythium] brassicae (nom. inval.)]
MKSPTAAVTPLSKRTNQATQWQKTEAKSDSKSITWPPSDEETWASPIRPPRARCGQESANSPATARATPMLPATILEVPDRSVSTETYELPLRNFSARASEQGDKTMKTSTISLSLAFAALTSISTVSAFGCKPNEVRGWMTACDSLTGSSQSKCDNRACHTALHRLVEQETIDCYVESNLGPASDMDKYATLDHFCHGEGPDPAFTPAPTTAAPTMAPTTIPATPSAPSTTPTTAPTSSIPTTPTPALSVPTVIPKPQC